MALTNVVVGVDGSPESDEALGWALDDATLLQMPLDAVTVLSPSERMKENDMLAATSSVTQLRSRPHADLASQVDRAAHDADSSDVSIRSSVLYGDPAEELIRVAGDDGLLVVGSRGRGGIKASMLGSVSRSCAQYARAAVVVVRGTHRRHDSGGRIIVGVDGSAASLSALRLARDTAAVRKAQLVVLHAWTLPYLALSAPAWAVKRADEAEAETLARLRLDDSLRQCAVDAAWAQVVLVKAFAGPALLAAAEGADLLVVGTRGLGGWKGLLLGSVSMQCLTHSPCPVLVARDQQDI